MEGPHVYCWSIWPSNFTLREQGEQNWIGNVRAVLFLMYGVSARPLIERGFRWFFVVPLAPNRDCSQAHLLYRRIGLHPVHAQSGKFYS